MAKDAHVVVVGIPPEVWQKMSDAVNSPKHYNVGKIEVIDAIEDWKLCFNLGNVVKYVARAWHKGKYVEDLKKAAWYLQREIDHSQGDRVPFAAPPTADSSLTVLAPKVVIDAAELEGLRAALETEKDMVRDKQHSLNAAISRNIALRKELAESELRFAEEFNKPEPVELQHAGYPLAGALADAVVGEYISEAVRPLKEVIFKFAARYFANAQDTSDKFALLSEELHQLRLRTHKARFDALVTVRQLASFHKCDPTYMIALDNLIELNKARKEEL